MSSYADTGADPYDSEYDSGPEEPLPEQYETLFSSTSTTKNATEMNLSSLTLEDATVGLEKFEKVQVYKNGKVAYSTDNNVVHLLTLHSGKQKGT